MIANAQEFDLQAEFEAMTSINRFHWISDYEDVVETILSGKVSGIPFVFAPKLAFRAGEVTVWGGMSGHGKSLITGQVAMQLALAGERVGISSFEMSGARTISRMVRQHFGEKSAKGISAFLKPFNRKICLLEHQGIISPEAALGTLPVYARSFGCTHVIIDNLMKVVAGDDDYNAQKNFVQQLCDFARQLNIHIHLIHHVRKGKDENEEISKFSFKGSSSIVDQVDNAILIQRNRKKEKQRAEAIQKRENFLIKDADEGDSIMRIVKQRNGDWEGEVHLWFNPQATTFCLGPERVTPWKIEAPADEENPF